MNDNPPRQPAFQSPSTACIRATSSQRQAVLVLGMHRSGTSALGGIISALGVAGPKTLASPNEWNPRGYFESPRIFTAHDELLAAIDSCWDDWRRLDPRQVDAKAGRHRQAIKELLIDEFGDEPFIFIKDPRICRFVPFTLSILADLNVSPVAALPIRNPLEVAHSLKRREKFSLSKSVLLWTRHVLDAEFYSRSMPRCILSYEHILTDWRRQVARISEETGIRWPDRSNRTKNKIDDYLTADLRHERFSIDAFTDHPAVVPLAFDTYNALTDIVTQGERKELLDRLDQLRTKFNEACRTFEPTFADFSEAQRNLASEHDSLRSEHDSLRSERASLRSERDNLAAARDSLLASQDILVSELGKLKAERDALASLRSERDNLAAARDSLLAGQDVLVSEHGKLKAERDALAAERIRLVAVRDALLGSHSWRLMAPLRIMRMLFAGVAPGSGFIERLIVAIKRLWRSFSRSVQ